MLNELKEPSPESKTLESQRVTPEDTPEQKAAGIYENYRKFVDDEGGRKSFIAYFIYESAQPKAMETAEAQNHVKNGVKLDHQQIEYNFLGLLGVDVENLKISEEPVVVECRNNTTLYRWSNIFHGKNGEQIVFDAMYQACKESKQPLRPVSER